MKKQKIYPWIAVGIALWLCLTPSETVQASPEAEKLPQIVQWENGNGLDADGTALKDTWAYDTVNPAGRYVLFGEEGEVLKKQEMLGDKEEIDYTSTETDFGKLGFRCTYFASFEGCVTVTMKGDNGGTAACELSPQNYYEANIPVRSGSYTLQSAVAEWEGENYLIEVAEDMFEVREDSMTLVNLRITERVLARQEEETAVEEREPAADKNTQADEKNETDREVRQEMAEQGMKPFLFLGIALVAGTLGYLIYKKKHEKYA